MAITVKTRMIRHEVGRFTYTLQRRELLGRWYVVIEVIWTYWKLTVMTIVCFTPLYQGSRYEYPRIKNINGESELQNSEIAIDMIKLARMVDTDEPQTEIIIRSLCLIVDKLSDNRLLNN